MKQRSVLAPGIVNRSEKDRILLVARKMLSPGQRAALRSLVTELKIWHYHRKGIRRIRREILFRPLKINLGCGNICKTGFLNIDLFPGGDLTLDLREGLPFESNCCELIFSEHFFEHIDYPEPISYLFGECLRVLRPGGVLTFSVPDTEWPLVDYQSGTDAPYFQACAENPWWHPPYCTTRLEHINYHFRQHGQHLFAYDEETARKVLEEAGFVRVARRNYQHDLDSERRRIGSLFMLAEKPANVMNSPY
jgi:predicted SAM-dependent methyltransferase